MWKTSVCVCDDLQVMEGAVWSLMLRSRLSLRLSMLWIQTRLQPQSWSLTLRLWCTTLRPAPSQISPLDREETIFITTALSWGFPLLFLCHVVLLFFLCASSLFRYVDEGALFSRPTYAAFLAVLDNYQRMTGQTEDFSPQQLAEQETFVKETMSNTELGRELFAFLYTKGNYLQYILTLVQHDIHIWSDSCSSTLRDFITALTLLYSTYVTSCSKFWNSSRNAVFHMHVILLISRCLCNRGRVPLWPEDDVVWSVLPLQQEDGLQRLWAHLCRFGQRYLSVTTNVLQIFCFLCDY